MYRSYYSILVMLLYSLSLTASGSDSLKTKYLYRLSYDVAKLSQLARGSYAWQEFQLERINKKNGIMYLEAGAGAGKVQNTLLDYTTSGFFMRWGLAQNIVYRASFLDIETASIGFRYGGAWCRNSDINYVTEDPVYGVQSGTQAANSMYRHWIEVSLGMKYGLTHRWFVGWTLRGAYKLNKPDVEKISPYIIPGFGRGDRTSSVNFNLYVSYLL